MPVYLCQPPDLPATEPWRRGIQVYAEPFDMIDLPTDSSNIDIIDDDNGSPTTDDNTMDHHHQQQTTGIRNRHNQIQQHSSSSSSKEILPLLEVPLQLVLYHKLLM